MTKRERVYAALAHQPVDKVPKGELAIDAGLANRLLGGAYRLDFQDYEREKAVRELLHMDYINLGDWPTWRIGTTGDGAPLFTSVYGEQFVDNGTSKHIVRPPFEEIGQAVDYPIPDIKKVSGHLIRRFAQETDLFVFAQIGGPVSMLNEMLGMEDYLVYAMLNTKEICILAKKVMTYEVEKAKLFLDSGANAILIADDIAFNSGLLLPPYIMDEVAFPFYKSMIEEIKAYRDVPVVLHTDGKISQALSRIVDAGFDGIHSLQPSAGMDIAQVKRQYGDKLCLMGNIDLDYIMTFAPAEEVRKNVIETIQTAGKGSGFILSTCNILVDVIPQENVWAMYEAAEQYRWTEV